MPDRKKPAKPIAVSDSATSRETGQQTGKQRAFEPAQPPVDDPEEEEPGGLDVPTGD